MNRLKVGRKMSREQMVKEIKAGPALFLGASARQRLGKTYGLNRYEINAILDEVIADDPDLETMSLKIAGEKYCVSPGKIRRVKEAAGMDLTVPCQNHNCARLSDADTERLRNHPDLLTGSPTQIAKELGCGKDTVSRMRRTVEDEERRNNHQLINKFILRGAA